MCVSVYLERQFFRGLNGGENCPETSRWSSSLAAPQHHHHDHHNCGNHPLKTTDSSLCSPPPWTSSFSLMTFWRDDAPVARRRTAEQSGCRNLGGGTAWYPLDSMALASSCCRSAGSHHRSLGPSPMAPSLSQTLFEVEFRPPPQPYTHTIIERFARDFDVFVLVIGELIHTVKSKWNEWQKNTRSRQVLIS